MKIILVKRRSGKTRKSIELSTKTGQTIFSRQSVEVLLARIEELEADRAGILSVLSEMVDEAQLQDPFQDDTGLSLLHGAKMLLNKERKS